MTTRKHLSLTDKMGYGAMIIEAEAQGTKQAVIRRSLNLSGTVYASCKTIYLETNAEAEKNRKIKQDEEEAAPKEQRRIIAKAVLMLKEVHPKSYEYVAKCVTKVQEMEQVERLEAAKAEIEAEFKRKLACIEDKLTGERVELDNMLPN